MSQYDFTAQDLLVLLFAKIKHKKIEKLALIKAIFDQVIQFPGEDRWSTSKLRRHLGFQHPSQGSDFSPTLSDVIVQMQEDGLITKTEKPQDSLISHNWYQPESANLARLSASTRDKLCEESLAIIDPIVAGVEETLEDFHEERESDMKAATERYG